MSAIWALILRSSRYEKLNLGAWVQLLIAFGSMRIWASKNPPPNLIPLEFGDRTSPINRTSLIVRDDQYPNKQMNFESESLENQTGDQKHNKSFLLFVPPRVGDVRRRRHHKWLNYYQPHASGGFLLSFRIGFKPIEVVECQEDHRSSQPPSLRLRQLTHTHFGAREVCIFIQPISSSFWIYFSSRKSNRPKKHIILSYYSSSLALG